MTLGFNTMEGETFSFGGNCTPDGDTIIEAIVFPLVYLRVTTNSPFDQNMCQNQLD